MRPRAGLLMFVALATGCTSTPSTSSASDQTFVDRFNPLCAEVAQQADTAKHAADPNDLHGPSFFAAAGVAHDFRELAGELRKAQAPRGRSKALRSQVIAHLAAIQAELDWRQRYWGEGDFEEVPAREAAAEAGWSAWGRFFGAINASDCQPLSTLPLP